MCWALVHHCTILSSPAHLAGEVAWAERTVFPGFTRTVRARVGVQAFHHQAPSGVPGGWGSALDGQPKGPTEKPQHQVSQWEKTGILSGPKLSLALQGVQGLMRRDKDRKPLPTDPGHTRLPVWSEPPTDLAPRLENPYSSDPPCEKGTSWNKMAMVSHSFPRAPTEPGSNDLRRAGPRATCPSSQYTALNPCPRNASLKQKSL